MKHFLRINLLKTVLSIICFIGLDLTIKAQAPAILWDKTIGGSSTDELIDLQQTSDGGYILGGSSASNISGDKSENNKASLDYWIIKLDAAGNKLWDRTIGGNGYDVFISLQQTIDGGYILGGYTGSNIFGDKTEASKGGDDYWIVKLDAGGNKIWDKTIGSSGEDRISCMQQTADGGYILGGDSNGGISGDKTEAHRGTWTKWDYWVVKLDASGNKLWDKTIGGSNGDYLSSVQQTSDGRYILGGGSDSGISDDKSEAGKGGSDCWVVKLDSTGNKLWDKTIGGNMGDGLNTILQTADGGYLLGANSESGISGDKSQASKGYFDCWVVKLDSNGNKVWDKTIGGSISDFIMDITKTSDGGYIFGAWSPSGISGDKTEANKGGFDYWIVKVNANGTKMWDKTIGGSGDDLFTSLQQTSDGGYILGGASESGISGNKTVASKGGRDYWIIKQGGQFPTGLTPETIAGNKLSIYPNPTKAEQEVNIHLPAALTGTTIAYIYDMPGKLIRQQSLTAKRQQQLNLKGLKPGMYQVKVMGNNQSSTIKLIVKE